MKEFLTPKKIKDGYLEGELNEDKAIELLISLIEGSDDIKSRVNSIKILENLRFRSEKIFKTLENYLISDQDAILRATTAEYIILNFLDEGITPLSWVIQHDKSPLVFRVFYNNINRFADKKFELILSRLDLWKNEFASNLGIVPEESRFFLDLEALFAENEKNYETDISSYKIFQNLADIKGKEPWLVINNKHVESLNFNYYKWKFIKENLGLTNSFSKLIDLDFYINSIKQYSYKPSLISTIPESIGSLIYLKKLNLSKNGLESIPYSLKKLIWLQELDLSYNNLQEFPKMLTSINSLEKLNLKHNKIQRIPDSLWNFLNSLETFYI